jgi:hypothetical protein
MSFRDCQFADLLKNHAVAYRIEALLDPIPAPSLSPTLQETLRLGVPMALATNTEKGRSEWMVAPVLLELWRLQRQKISVFSGAPLTATPELSGICDFMITHSQPYETPRPIVVLVEAKNDQPQSGYGQCLAEMLAAQMLNQQVGINMPVYGVATSGNLWHFMRLQDNDLQRDPREFHINQPEAILGLLVWMTTLA